MIQQPFRIVQVGMGGMGNAWLSAALHNPEVELAGFVEVNPAIAEAQAARHHLDHRRIFPTLAEAIAAVQPDGVIDVTPPRFHRDISVTALRAGVPVLSEKPLAPTLAEAREIVAVANETGVMHMVAQNYRYSVPVQTLKSVLASGELGAVGSVRIDFFRGPHFGGFREEMDYPLIVDMAIHHFDLLRFFLGHTPVAVAGRSWNPPWSWYRGDASASVTFVFADNCVATYNGSWCSQAHETPWNGNWRFDCERGVVELLNDQVIVHAGKGAPDASAAGPAAHPAPRVVPPAAMPEVGQAYLLRQFYRAVRQNTAPETHCRDNLLSLQMVFDAIQAFQNDGAQVRA